MSNTTTTTPATTAPPATPATPATGAAATAQGVQSTIDTSTDLVKKLTNVLAGLVGSVLGSQAVDKAGKPLREVAYIQMPLGTPIDPRDFSNPWTPAGGDTLANSDSLGQIVAKTGGPAATPPPATPAAGSATPAAGTSTPAAGTSTSATAAKPAAGLDIQLAHSLQSAANTANFVDRLLKVTDDGSYVPYMGNERISSAYDGITRKAQGIPAPKLPDSIQKAVNEARALLFILSKDEKGNVKLGADGQPLITGKRTDGYQLFTDLSKAWAKARATFALAEEQALRGTDQAVADAWPVTQQALQADVDSAWNDWRAAGADTIENALDTVESVGGSIGAYFVNQSREVFRAWDLGLTGPVAVGTPYSYVLPSSWYDPRDSVNGFDHLHVTASTTSDSFKSDATTFANNYWQGSSVGVQSGVFGSVFGVNFGSTVGVDAAQQSSSTNQGGTFHALSTDTMTNVEIELDYGLCTIYRPWLVSELFVIDGWYLPGEKEKVISAGTVADNKDSTDQKFLPMIPSQMLVVRNVKIRASGWGSTGDRMEQWTHDHLNDSSSSQSSVSAGVGFLSFGGYAKTDVADWEGTDRDSGASKQSWSFTKNGEMGELSIWGCQVVGWVGEIIPPSPRIPDPQLATAKK